jgi:RNA polymerase sigma factor (sigma-70 family)
MESESASFDASTLLKRPDWLRDLVRTLVRDEHQADDVVQEAWLAAMTRAPRKNPRGFLRSAARNIALRLRSRDTRRDRHERLAARPERLPTTADVVERESLRREVVNTVLALADPNRTIVLLRYFEDDPPKAIARRLGISVEATRRRLRQAEEEIRRRLRARYGDRWSSAILPVLGVSATATTASIGVAIANGVKALVVVAAATGVYLLIENESAGPEIPGPRETATAARHPAHPRPRPVHPVTSARRNDPVRGSPADRPDEPRADGAWPVARGTVTASDGTPIPGACVQAVLPGPLRVVAETRCDSSGNYALYADLRGRLSFELEASAAGRYTDGRLIRQGEVIHFRLGRAARLTGRVTLSGSTTGLAGVRVSAGSANPRYHGHERKQECTTDPDGCYRFEALRPGRQRVSARLLNTELSLPFETWIRVVAGRTTRLDVVLEKSDLIELTGRVVAEGSGRPLAEVPVRIGSKCGTRDVQTDRTGRFRAKVTPVDFEVHPHRMVRVGDRYFSLIACERDGEEAIPTYRLRYQPAKRWTGVLIDGRGQPVPGAVYTRLPFTRPGGTAVTDANGRLQLMARPGRVPERLEFRLPGSRPRTLIASHRSAADASGPCLVFRWPDGGTVSGLVRRPDGRPMPAARVEFNNQNRRAHPRRFSGVARPDGRFVIRDLTLGRYSVRVDAPGFPEFGADTMIDVLPGRHVMVDDLVAPGGLDLSGVVMDEHGRTAPSIWVSAERRIDARTHFGPVCGRTDHRGRFQLHGLPEGRYELSARDRGRTASVSGIPAGERDVRLRLEPVPVLTGRIRFAEGRRPATAFHVRLVRAGWRAHSSAHHVSDSEGRLELRLPKPGDYDVEVTAKHAGATFEGRGQVTVHEGEAPPEFTILLIRTRSIAGFVRSADGTPIRGAEVMLVREGSVIDAPRRATTTDSSGRFTLRAVPPGECVLRCRRPGWVPAEQRLTLATGAYPVVDLTLSAEGGRVRVSVTDPEGRPVAGARVHLHRTDGSLLAPERSLYEQAYFARKRTDPELDYASWYRSYNFTGPDGVLVRRFLPAGRFQVRVEAEGFRTARSWIRIRTHAESTTRLVLAR